MFACSVLATLAALYAAPARAQDREPAPPIPFEALGQALIAAADARRGGEPTTEGDDPEVLFLRRIEPLHQRVRLGAIELWVPAVTITCELELGPALPLAQVAPIAKAALKLERQWTELAGLDGGDAARAKKAFTRIEAWANSLSAPRLAESTPELVAEHEWLSACFRRDPSNSKSRGKEKPFGLVMLLAPDRAHYLALLGAAGVLDGRFQKWFWDPSGRRSAGTPLYRGSCLVPLSYGPNTDDGPHCESHPLEPQDRVQLAIHTLSHTVTSNVTPVAPTWFAEGLALFDTIRATGGDETLCTGVREQTQTMMQLGPGNTARGPAGMLVWVTREASPYRDGSSPRFFLKELAAARDAKRGFAILDLDAGKVAQYERGPLLGARAVLPDSIVTAPDGVKKGFAEFFRAYCAAFVDYLFETKLKNDRLLHLVLAELQTRTYDASQEAPDDLLEALEKWTNKSLDPTSAGTDSVERAFGEWLARKR
ncbi:MAG: hypothetical protein IT453_20405 [Planctomycetes bacterium]|nr:hypothetical protein [Planctomycetota bacterium]